MKEKPNSIPVGMWAKYQEWIQDCDLVAQLKTDKPRYSGGNVPNYKVVGAGFRPVGDGKGEIILHLTRSDKRAGVVYSQTVEINEVHRVGNKATGFIPRKFR